MTFEKVVSSIIIFMHKRFPFTEQEDKMILEAMKRHKDDWESVAEYLPGRSPKQIRDRFMNYLRDGLKNTPWTKQEDDILIEMFNEIGPKWSKMKSKLPGRSGNDIKNRWHKHLFKRIIQSIALSNYPILSNQEFIINNYYHLLNSNNQQNTVKKVSNNIINVAPSLQSAQR